MKFIQGTDRNQATIFPVTLEQAIDDNNDVRFIDAFVDSLDLEKFGFKFRFIENGRPAFRPSDLLKLYLYGYMNKIRSSRHLEKECKRNIELIWLLRSLSPDHNTIANFRRDNPDAIKKVFHSTVKLARHFNLIGAKLIAGDSVKLRAQNSKKNNFNQKKIERHIEYIDNKLKGYTEELSQADGDRKQVINAEMNKHLKRRGNYSKLKKELKETEEVQISTSDPESRQMIIRNNITEVAYNIQATTDADHKMIVDYKVTNENDAKAMGGMLRRAKTILRTNSLTALYDKGYHTGSELCTADQIGITTLVAVPAISSASTAPDPAYNVEHFSYLEDEDCYTCPQGHKLYSNGSWYKARNYRFRQFKTPACKGCPVRSRCTAAKHNGKIVQRTEYTKYIEANARRVEVNQELYKRRQSIVEHPFGTIKRQWGFDHIMTKKGMKKASSDVGLIFTAYNLRRVINIMGISELLRHYTTMFNTVFSSIINHLQPMTHIVPKSKLYAYLNLSYSKTLILQCINQKRIAF